jgi:hypothetical protein
MVKIKKSSSTALLVVAAIFTAIGGMIASPEGRLLSLLVAGLMALAVLLLGPSLMRRIIASFIVAAVVLQAIPSYRQYHSFHERHVNDRNEDHRAKSIE